MFSSIEDRDSIRGDRKAVTYRELSYSSGSLSLKDERGQEERTIKHQSVLTYYGCQGEKEKT